MTIRARKLNDDALIVRHIEQDPISPDRARLSPSGVPIWAFVAYLRAVGDDFDAVAAEYALSEEEVAATLVYYQRHRALLDARILLQESAFT
jgi:uncharacterized protein (DUF433 family)